MSNEKMLFGEAFRKMQEDKDFHYQIAHKYPYFALATKDEIISVISEKITVKTINDRLKKRHLESKKQKRVSKLTEALEHLSDFEREKIELLVRSLEEKGKIDVANVKVIIDEETDEQGNPIDIVQEIQQIEADLKEHKRKVHKGCGKKTKGVYKVTKEDLEIYKKDEEIKKRKLSLEEF